MRTFVLGTVASLVAATVLGQGTVNFNNRVAGAVEARVLLPDGTGAGAGWLAQLYAGPAGSATGELQPIPFTTGFRTTSPQAQGYVNPITVEVPGVAAGGKAKLVLRVYNGSSYEMSAMRGESGPIEIVLGGGTLPPVNLLGLQGFTVGRSPAAFAITASAEAHGSVQPVSALKLKGQSQEFVASPETGYLVHQWFLNGDVVQTGGTAFLLSNIDADHSLSVSFAPIPNGGAVAFNNRISGLVDARVLFNGAGLGAGWTAQLYGGPEGTPLANLKALLPATTFRTSSEAAMGYVTAVDVVVPGVAPNDRATLVMQAFKGATFETSTARGKSAPITIVVGGGVLPPANLVGLQSFTVHDNLPTFRITASAGAHGNITPGGTKIAVQGNHETFVAMPDVNYAVNQWAVDGQVVQTGANSYTLANVQADHTVSVTFAPLAAAGTVVFNNRIPGLVDARVLLPDGTGAGAGWTAQLYGAAEGSAAADFKPLTPTTTFRTSSSEAQGYVNAVNVSVPGVAPGAKAMLAMRVFNGADYESSTRKGETAPITVALGGGMLPPANLVGLVGFTLPGDEIPVPPNHGLVNFNNRIPGIVDARVSLPNGTGVGVGWTAQLYGGPEGGRLVPLTPTTAFRTSSLAAMGYVNGVVVAVPAVPPGGKATLVMAAYNGATFEASSMFGQSEPITVTLGGGPLPPPNLVGLKGFTVTSSVPILLIQPANQSVAVGGSVRFTVQASGAGPLIYQWAHNGSALAGATTASLTLNNVRSSQAGSYTVTIRNAAGAVTSSPATLTVLAPATKGDFNGDGFADLLFQDEAGFVAIWFMDGATLKSSSFLTPNNVRDNKWRIVGTGHFSADSNEDILFQHRDGALSVWYMNGTTRVSASFLDPMETGDRDWQVVGTGDFNRDGKVDLLFQHEDGTLAVWHMDGISLTTARLLQPAHPGDSDWRVIGAGDFNGDGKTDLIYQHEDGALAVWFMDGIKLSRSELLDPYHPGDKKWRVTSIADLNHDGKQDLVFEHDRDGALAVWFMDGITLTSARLLKPSRAGGSWELVAP